MATGGDGGGRRFLGFGGRGKKKKDKDDGDGSWPPGPPARRSLSNEFRMMRGGLRVYKIVVMGEGGVGKSGTGLGLRGQGKAREGKGVTWWPSFHGAPQPLRPHS